MVQRPPDPAQASSAESELRRQHTDDILVTALATGDTYAEAARLAGVTERTVGRRMATADFSARVGAAREERVAVMCGALTALGPRAVAKLDELLDSADQRLGLLAAREILTETFRARRQYQLEADVRALRNELIELKAALDGGDGL